MHVLVDDIGIIIALTEDENIIKWWRKRNPGNKAIKRTIINTREDWVRYFDPGWYDAWIRSGERIKNHVL